MRRLIVPIAIVLALVTGAVLAETLRTLESTPLVEPPDTRDGNEALVRMWYRAINETIRTGDPAALERLVAPGFVDHAGTGEPVTGRAAFEESLLGLRAAYPETRLVPLDVADADDLAVVRVGVEGTAGGQFLGLPLADGRAWGTVDLLRVASGAIAERWGGEGEAVARFAPYLAATVAVPAAAPQTVALERRTYAPGWGETTAFATGFSVYYVDAGELRIDLDPISLGPAWRIASASTSAPDPMIPLDTGATATLEAGDALVVGYRARVAIRNDGASAAVALVVSVAAGARATDPFGNDVSVATPAPWNIADDLLSGGLVEGPAENITVRIGRATLPPGGGVAPHPVNGVELLAVESGEAVVAASDDAARVLRGPDPRSVPVDTALLARGQGALIRQCASAQYRSAGNAPLDLLVATIAPAAAPATPR